jgi:hypothetical protein
MYTPGQKFKPSASMFNELDKVARAYRNNANSAVGGTGQRAPATTIVWANNNTGGEVARGAPAWLSIAGAGSAWQNTAMTPEAIAYTCNAIPFASFAGSPTTRTTPANIQGIALDTAAAGKMMPVAIAGLAWARVKLSVVNGNAPSIGPLDNSDSDKLTHHGRDTFGPHRIIATDSGTSSALVIVNAGVLSMTIGRVGTTAIAAGAFGDVWSGPTSNASTTDRQLFKVKNPGSEPSPANATVAIALDGRTGEITIISEYC